MFVTKEQSQLILSKMTRFYIHGKRLMVTGEEDNQPQ
jgi:hypothetical protein